MDFMQLMKEMSATMLLNQQLLREDDIYPIAYCCVEYGNEGDFSCQKKEDSPDYTTFLDLLRSDIEITPVKKTVSVPVESDAKGSLKMKIRKILSKDKVYQASDSTVTAVEPKAESEVSGSADEESGSGNEQNEEVEEQNENEKCIFSIELIEQILQKQLTYEEKYLWTKLMKNTYGSTKVYNKLYMSKETDHKWICYYCTVCVEGNMDKFLEHFSEWHAEERPLLSCNFCPQFRSPKEHQNHIKAHLMENGCVLCDLWCGKAHVAYHVDVQEVASAFPVIGDAIRFKCKECPNESLKNANEFVRHCHTAHGTNDSIFQCEKCNEIFGVLRKFQQHDKIAHFEPHDCKKCGRRITSYTMTFRHPCASSSRTCEVCGKVLGSKAILKRHMKQVHSPRQFPCELCTESFKDAKLLLDHMNYHKGVKPYKCLICGSNHASKAALAMHLRGRHDTTIRKMKEQCLEKSQWHLPLQPDYEPSAKKARTEGSPSHE